MTEHQTAHSHGYSEVNISDSATAHLGNVYNTTAEDLIGE